MTAMLHASCRQQVLQMLTAMTNAIKWAISYLLQCVGAKWFDRGMCDAQAKQMNKSDDDFSAVLEAVLNSKAWHGQVGCCSDFAPYGHAWSLLVFS